MPRHSRPEVPGPLEPMINSFDLALQSDGRSPRTRQMYTDAVRWLAGSLPEGVDDWADVTYRDVRVFLAGLAATGYSKAYRNNIGRCLQAWDKWYAVEEGVARLFSARLSVPEPPKLGEIPVPLLAVEHLAQLLAHAEVGRNLAARRDAAILRLFASTGCRLAELAGLRVDDINLTNREMTVTGKGSLVRTVRFDAKAARAVDRYLRVRAKHKNAASPMLWLGLRRAEGLSPRGLYRVVRRRGRDIGIDVHPHLFRHGFAHHWLDQGGAEGDLMALMGWESPEMLRLYGRSARGARARRAYDRIDVMRGA